MTDMKEKILTQLKLNLQTDLECAIQAYETAHNLVTDEQLKSEGKYDTRAIEAGYLAGAQKRRKEELEHEIALLEEISLEHTGQSVCVGSLAQVEYNQMKRWYFVSSTSGGTMLNIDGTGILVISAFSPLGSEMIGLTQGDSFELEAARGSREYKIISII